MQRNWNFNIHIFSKSFVPYNSRFLFSFTLIALFYIQDPVTPMTMKQRNEQRVLGEHNAEGNIHCSCNDPNINDVENSYILIRNIF